MNNCRHCEAPLKITFADLGHAPPSNSYLGFNDLVKPESFFPLKVLVCEKCWLVQTQDFVAADHMFEDEYAYFSSTSTSWLKHAEHYAVSIIDRLELDKGSFVVELASNDGYLLKNFLERQIPCLGVEPTLGTAKVAQSLGIDVLLDFFTEDLSRQVVSTYSNADLIIGNNVFAHVPDINDFTKGMKNMLSDDGVITLEFPHFLNLLKHKQFDTIYHEHFSYLSLASVTNIFERHGLKIFDVEHIDTHGGSLRVYGCHERSLRGVEDSVSKCIALESEFGLKTLEAYSSFQPEIDAIKNEFLKFLIQCVDEGKSVAAYGAAAKGNTLINYCGVKTDLIDFVCDAAASKQGKYLPGSHIPIVDSSYLDNTSLDYVLILPWNLADEIADQLDYLRQKGTKFVTAIPALRIF